MTDHWQPDPLNPLRMETAQMNVSVLRMSDARPFPDWSAMRAVPRGRVYEHSVDSDGDELSAGASCGSTRRPATKDRGWPIRC